MTTRTESTVRERARTLAAYLGGSTKFDHAIAVFAESYADQHERDHAALQAAVKDGRVQATMGV